MKRTVIEQLIKWKNKSKRKPLLVTGVRQCGKTYILKEFGKQEFIDVAYFNFDGSNRLSSIFDFDLDVRRIIDELNLIRDDSKISVGKTLVIFDEIQECPKAIQSLKYFYEDMPELHVIAAGSLLGVAIRKEGFSFPVGKVERLEMHPMSFEEFVIADGGEKYISAIKNMDLTRELSLVYTVPMEKYLKNYYIVGGMPEVVQTWVDTHDYKEVDIVLDRILKDYGDDFGKHTSADTAIKIRLIWDCIPVQIAKENNKFIFSHVKKGARAKDLEDALTWIVNAGIVHKLDLVEHPSLPLSAMADTTYFKIYMTDIGLLRKKANINYRTILFGDASFKLFKGALTENYVMMQLSCLGIDSYFYRSKSDAEIDFIIDYDGLIIPIEVKAADNTKAKSLHVYNNRYNPKMAIKTSLKNVGDNMDGNTHVYSIPLTCLFRLKDYIEYEIGESYEG